MQLVELASGCVCCSIGDEGGVEASVRKLLQQGSWDHIVLEASGVADTSSLAMSIGTMRLEGAAWLASCRTGSASIAEQLNKRKKQQPAAKKPPNGEAPKDGKPGEVTVEARGIKKKGGCCTIS